MMTEAVARTAGLPDAMVEQIELAEIIIPHARLRRLQTHVVKMLAESMAEIGLINPVIVAEDAQLIAGWHRIEAAKQLGWSTIAGIITEDRSADLLRLREIDENLARAELSPAERAAHHAARRAIYEREHPETRHGAMGGGHQQSRKNCDSVVRYSDHAARNFGVSERTIQLEVARGAIPEVVTLAGTALDKPGELDALAQLPSRYQAELIERARSGEKISAKITLKNLKREEREAALAERTAATADEIGSKLYGVIYADPPWRFEPWSRQTGMDRAADNHYPTMTLDDIIGQRIPAAADCVLFMWATAPMLVEALEVMRAWGFAYKTHCTWSKTRQGTGYWFRSAHELLLVGTRGEVPAPAPGSQSSSVIEAAPARHSEKPAVFAEMIEALFPNAARLEMFARQSREGWDRWGNEAPN
jgi:N6-adenosine-specific RNA methylase IME4/ParB-like chromosome segregation protein Spo0J